MNKRRVGLWLIGACGGVGTTAALGLAALAEGLASSTGLVTALPGFAGLDLDDPADFVVGGHDIRRTDFLASVSELQRRANIFSPDLVTACRDRLASWARHVRPGTVLSSGPTIADLADWPGVAMAEPPLDALARIGQDLASFRADHRLDQVVVVNVASTEPPAALSELHESLPRLRQALENRSEPSPVPASSLYGWAALEQGMPYVNFTPSLGLAFPAGLELAAEQRGLLAGQDGKTGETLLKSVLAPMFVARHLRLLSWVGHNIFGNRDAVVLHDPANKASKVKTKDQIIRGIAGYSPQTLVSIEYIESLDDWKTAWDHIHFEGFLGVKMTLQFTWQGCDSALAGPLVIDLARLSLLAQRQGETGVLAYLASFFKSPLGTAEHNFFKQLALLESQIARWRGTATEHSPRGQGPDGG